MTKAVVRNNASFPACRNADHADKMPPDKIPVRLISNNDDNDMTIYKVP